MDIFDILGPVMVGPSSSHTAGAARIGAMARTLLGEEVADAKLHLYGSFAETGKGFGIDRCAMMLCGTDSIRDVILFPTMKPLD